MNLRLIAFQSPLHPGTSLEEAHRPLLDGLRSRFNLELIPPSMAQTGENAALFIASGGVEGLVREAFPNLPRPFLLLTDGQHNSLAASLEIASWLRRCGEDVEILHGDPEELAEHIEDGLMIQKARQALAVSRLGFLGMPSPWLIASNVDYEAVQQRWGTALVDIRLSELKHQLSVTDAGEAKILASQFEERLSGFLEATREDLADAARVHLALRTLCGHYALDAVTVKCFELLESIRTTGCLSLALLNDEGIVAGCEGDGPAAFSMLLFRRMTGRSSFMCNPSSIDRKTREIVLAHCTIAPSLCGNIFLRSHFESGLSVGIQGELPLGPITLFKCGGESLDRFFVSEGELLANLNEPGLCRTQVRVRLEEDVEYFYRNPLANHHILAPGRWGSRLTRLMESAGCIRVK